KDIGLCYLRFQLPFIHLHQLFPAHGLARTPEIYLARDGGCSSGVIPCNNLDFNPSTVKSPEHCFNILLRWIEECNKSQEPKSQLLLFHRKVVPAEFSNAHAQYAVALRRQGVQRPMHTASF